MPPWVWASIAVLVLLAALAAGAWWWLQRQQQGADDAQRARLAALLEKQKSLDAELAGIKPVDPTECPPGEVRMPIGGPAAPVSPGVPPNPSANPGVDPAAGGATLTALPRPKLTDLLERSTAMVIVRLKNGTGTGSGFFISPNLLVTNRHVVEKSDGATVLLASQSLKTIRRGTVLSTTPNSDPGHPDFALVRLDEGTAPATLEAATTTSKLEDVVAAGYPALITDIDSRFNRLMNGDMSAAPDLSLTQGVIQSFQVGFGGSGQTPIAVHTAAISPGNSGGPLVDACGRLVGVNTSGRNVKTYNAQFAQRTEAVLAFLKAAGTSARVDARTCTRG